MQRFEKKNIIVNLGRTDAILPEKEQIPRERYRQGDRIRAFILDVEMGGKGPQIVLSRTHPGFLIKLFEQEVPEIYEGIVEVKGAAREPGGRAKIAVVSHDQDVDPVGACVGMKGTRVQSVVQELRGEKIDIVHWTPDPAEFVVPRHGARAVAKIVMDEDAHSMEVVVPDDQLSLAIGKKGQNVRLASRLTGWNLEVRSESEAEDEARRARLSLSAIPGVGDVTAELLFQHGFKSAEEVAQADEAALAEVDGIPERRSRAFSPLRAAMSNSCSARRQPQLQPPKRSRCRRRARPRERDSRRCRRAAAEPSAAEPVRERAGGAFVSRTRRHVPIRTCLGCGLATRQRGAAAGRARRATVRLALDAERRAGGRGGYLHRVPECWDALRASGRVRVRSLRATVDGRRARRWSRSCCSGADE